MKWQFCLWWFALLILTFSCSKAHFSTHNNLITYYSKVHFSTLNNLAWNTNTAKISIGEVSVNDWITFIVTTQFDETNSEIYLGRNIGKIKHLLPDSTIGSLSNYVIYSFLREDKKMVGEKVYNHCSGEIKYAFLPKTAWDSITKFKMLELPITGITFEQAQRYLIYKQDISNACKAITNEKQVRYECFLPSPQQFDSLLAVNDSINSLKCPLFNFKNSLCADCPSSKNNKNHPVYKNTGKQPVTIYTYFPTDAGLYNLKGNVAEMTSEKGIAKGGSCNHFASEAKPNKIQYYSKPESWLGFRVWYRLME